jgi:cytoskeletal protein CcmA (bactofilin family)
MENNSQSTIARGVEFSGTIKSEGALHIDGVIDGEILCQGDVTVGKSAQIKGNIDSNSVIVEGSVAGNLTAKDKIDMKSTAKVTGDIQSKRLAVEDGVTFVGKSEVNPAGATASNAAPASAPEPPLPIDEKKLSKTTAAVAGR